MAKSTTLPPGSANAFGIEVHQLTEPIEFEGVTHAEGTWVIPMDQPFANFVRQLFDTQEYPDLRQYPQGPPDQPYDLAGWTLPYQMDVRVVAATHRNLNDMISNGDFREDLFFRINVVKLTIPPLRERLEDLPRDARRSLPAGEGRERAS